MKRKVTSGICSVLVIIGLVVVNYAGEIRTSAAGLELIGNAEGCRNNPYKCPAGVLTVGVGSTTGSIDPIRQYSDEEIAARWVLDIKEAERCVNKFANGAELQQGTFDALVSITFNAGCGQMQKSTMFKLIRSGDLVGACEQFPRWTYANGKVLPGLVTRREAERRLCLMGVTHEN